MPKQVNRKYSELRTRAKSEDDRRQGAAPTTQSQPGMETLPSKSPVHRTRTHNVNSLCAELKHLRFSPEMNCELDAKN